MAFAANGPEAEADVGKRVSALVALARNDEACRILGVDGALEGQLDVTFLDDPLDWIAYDIAAGIKAAESEEEDEPGPTLSLLVAEIRLYRLLRGDVDEIGLSRMVRDYLEAEG